MGGWLRAGWHNNLPGPVNPAHIYYSIKGEMDFKCLALADLCVKANKALEVFFYLYQSDCFFFHVFQTVSLVLVVRVTQWLGSQACFYY